MHQKTNEFKDISLMRNTTPRRWDYRVDYPNHNSYGNVEIILREKHEFLEGSDLFEHIPGSDEEKIAEIDLFDPHGTEYESEDIEILAKSSRKGIGSKVLEGICSDLLDAGIKYVYVYSPSNSFKQFILKKGFRDISNLEYFKVIG